MATVYRVWSDDNYQSLECSDYDAYAAARKTTWKFDGYRVDEGWRALEVYVRYPNLKKPDIWGLANTFAFEETAADKLRECLQYAGQEFKLPFEGRKLIVLNVTYVLNCLDKKRSEYDPELPHMIDKYAFHGDRLDYSIFKIPETQHGEILTVEGLAAPDQEFKPLVEKHGLKGLRFEELWSDQRL